MQKKLIAGVVGGLAGGIVFGMLMQMMGMIAMIASLMGSKSLIVGWMAHLIISIVIGLFFAWWFGNKSKTYGRGAGFGLIHGVIWWVIGPLTIMPLMLGMGVQYVSMFTTSNMISLMGHLIYGLVLGLVYVAVYGSKTKLTV